MKVLHGLAWRMCGHLYDYTSDLGDHLLNKWFQTLSNSMPIANEFIPNNQILDCQFNLSFSFKTISNPHKLTITFPRQWSRVPGALPQWRGARHVTRQRCALTTQESLPSSTFPSLWGRFHINSHASLGLECLITTNHVVILQYKYKCKTL